MSVADVDSPKVQRSVINTSRLLVTRRDPDTHSYHALGFLTYDGEVYRFSYLRAPSDESGFQALPGLADITREYVSHQLFPVFSERVISARRPDREVSMGALGLPTDAAPFEILQRSGGLRVGDAIEVLPAPTAAADGSLTVDFLVHGVRYQPAGQERIPQLQVGERLHIVPEHDNESNQRALLVTDSDKVRLGYVPDPLLELVHSLTDRTATVLRANGPEVGFHFRLLARVRGRVAAGHQPFSGPEWETVRA